MTDSDTGHQSEEPGSVPSARPGTIWPRAKQLVFRPIVLELVAIVFAMLSVELISERLSVRKGYVALTILLVLVPLLVTLRYVYSQVYVPLRAAQASRKWRSVLAFILFAVPICCLAGIVLVWAWSLGPRISSPSGDGLSKLLRSKASQVLRVYRETLSDCRLTDIALDSVRVDLAVVGTTGARDIYLHGRPERSLSKQSLVIDEVLGTPVASRDAADLRYVVEPWPCEGKKPFGSKYRRQTIAGQSFFIASTSIPLESGAAFSLHQGFCAPGVMDEVEDGFFLDLRRFPKIGSTLRVNLYTDVPAAIWVFALDPGDAGRPPVSVRASFARGTVVDSAMARRGIRAGYGFVIPREYHDAVLVVEYLRGKITLAATDAQ